MSIGIAAACQFTHGVAPTDDGMTPPVDAGMCTSLVNECNGDVLRFCKEVGGSAIDLTCGWGCIPGSAAHCAHVVPSGSGGVETNGVTAADVDGTNLGAVTLIDGETLDSDNGRIGTNGNINLHHGTTPGIENGIDFQFRGPMSIWRFKSLTINGTITVIGSRPLALVSDGAVTINGVVDARGLCSSYVAGPGGFSGGSITGANGSAPVSTMGGGEGASTSATGGGGGGYGGHGGSGDAAMGGSPFGDAQISVLIGGAGGGAGSGGGNFGRGGGGGGALQIISNDRVVVVAAGGINAGGCGGKAGTGNADSGGGGGAGGTILVEAPIVTVGGVLAVNGGGGGGGGGGNAKPGANGTLSRTPAAGGDPDGNMEQGGPGAAGGAAAGPGGNGTNPGGGGGAIGRIRINTRGGSGVDITNATLSPAPTDTDTTFSTGSATTL